MGKQQPHRPGWLSRILQPAFFGAVLGLLLWSVALQGLGSPIHKGSSGTPQASARPRLTRSCTGQEVAFNGAIEDCALPVGPIGTCTLNGKATPCGLPSGHPIPCDGVSNPSSGAFGASLTLLGATKAIYELSMGIPQGYHGAGPYRIQPTNAESHATVTVADSVGHQFWTATSGTLTINGDGKSGSLSIVLQASTRSTASRSPQEALMDGPWSCG